MRVAGWEMQISLGRSGLVYVKNTHLSTLSVKHSKKSANFRDFGTRTQILMDGKGCCTVIQMTRLSVDGWALRSFSKEVRNLPQKNGKRLPKRIPSPGYASY